MALRQATHGFDAWGTCLIFTHKLAGELAFLNLGEDSLHFLLGLIRNQARSASQTTIFRSVRHGVPHVGHPTLVEQVDNQFEFVQTFEIGHFRCIAGFHQGLKTRLHQRGSTTTQHSLLTKQIRFSFFTEVGFDNSGTPTTIGTGIRQCNVFGLTRRILGNRDQAGNTATRHVRGAYGMTRTFGCNHDHIQISSGFD